MIQLESKVESNNEVIKIFNRGKEYNINRKLLCSESLFFQKMFSGQFLESIEDQVTMDLCEDSFEAIMDYIVNGSICINFGNVIQLYDTCDYLMSDKLLNRCEQFFFNSFNIQFLPDICSTIELSPNSVIKVKLDNFICQHFLRFSQLSVFHEFPIETIKYILKLDLWIENEIQIFDAISGWIEFDHNSRISQTVSLMRLIRWQHMNDEDFQKLKSSKLYKKQLNIPDFRKLSLHDNNRCTTDYAFIVFELSPVKIQIKVQTKNNNWSSIGIFAENKKLKLDLIMNENMIDIIYDSGREGIRVDLEAKFFRYHEMAGVVKTYYRKLYQYIFSSDYKYKADEFNIGEANCRTTSEKISFVAHLDQKSFFTSISELHNRTYSNIIPSKFSYTVKSDLSEWSHKPVDASRKVHAACVNNRMFVMINSDNKQPAKFFYHDLDNTKSFSSLTLPDSNFDFNNIQLTILKSKPFLLDELTGKIYRYNERYNKWFLYQDTVSRNYILTITNKSLPQKIVDKWF